MRTYRQQSREDLDLTQDEWEELVDFIDQIRPSITTAREDMDIEAPPPSIRIADQETQSGVFNPGGWVGQYPCDVYVYPDKLTTSEYEWLIDSVAGWLEICDVPTAGAVLPLFHTDIQEWRSVLLGYSQAALAYTDDALAERPPVSVNRETKRGPKPLGNIDFQLTLQRRARGLDDVVYDTTTFSLDHPFNLLLIQFHATVGQELAQLAEASTVMKAKIRAHQKAHSEILQSAFPEPLIAKSEKSNINSPAFLQRVRNETQSHLSGLVDLWESFCQQRALSIEFNRQLNIGIKPISKLYELWVLSVILETIEESTGKQPEIKNGNLNTINIGSDLCLYYNTQVREHSRFLATEIGSHSGRPDYALEQEGKIIWVGDAKYSPEKNITLKSYQRLLTYTVDLMPADGQSTASIVHVDDSTSPICIETDDYRLTQASLRPSTTGETDLETQLRTVLDH